MDKIVIAEVLASIRKISGSKLFLGHLESILARFIELDLDFGIELFGPALGGIGFANHTCYYVTVKVGDNKLMIDNHFDSMLNIRIRYIPNNDDNNCYSNRKNCNCFLAMNEGKRHNNIVSEYDVIMALFLRDCGK